MIGAIGYVYKSYWWYFLIFAVPLVVVEVATRFVKWRQEPRD